MSSTPSERNPSDPSNDPFDIARAWLAEAEEHELNDPNAMALATADADGLPNVRMVLLKALDAPQAAPDGAPGRDGFVFYTNFESAKGGELDANPQAALVLHWKSLRRQIRARGRVARVAEAEADAYYATRGYQSRIGAWASQQSRPLSSRAALMAEVAKIGLRHPIAPPRPPHWGGFRITPLEIEFWRDGAHRLHDRFRWSRPDVDAAWEVARLSP